MQEVNKQQMGLFDDTIKALDLNAYEMNNITDDEIIEDRCTLTDFTS